MSKIMVQVVNQVIDPEWKKLLVDAKKSGISVDEIRQFLSKKDSSKTNMRNNKKQLIS